MDAISVFFALLFAWGATLQAVSAYGSVYQNQNNASQSVFNVTLGSSPYLQNYVYIPIPRRANVTSASWNLTAYRNMAGTNTNITVTLKYGQIGTIANNCLTEFKNTAGTWTTLFYNGTCGSGTGTSVNATVPLNLSLVKINHATGELEIRHRIRGIGTQRSVFYESNVSMQGNLRLNTTVACTDINTCISATDGDWSTFSVATGTGDCYVYQNYSVYSILGSMNVTTDSGIDGVIDNSTGAINNTVAVASLNATAITSYLLGTCTSDWTAGTCAVPFNLSSVSSGKVEVSAINISGYYLNAFVSCGTSGAIPILYAYFYDEVNLLQSNATLTYYLNITGTDNGTNGIVTNVRNTTICGYTANMHIDAELTYQNDTAFKRTWYYSNFPMTTAQNISLYLLTTAAGKKVQFEARDSSDNRVPEIDIQVKRHYLGEDTYRIVDIGRTDSEGKFIAYFMTDSTLYKSVIYLNNTALVEYADMAIADDGSVPIVIKLYTANLLPEYITAATAVSHTCTRNTAGNYTVCTITMPAGTFSAATLYVEKAQLSGYVSICENSSSGTSFTLSCYLGDNPAGDYKYTLQITGSPPIVLDADAWRIGSLLIDSEMRDAGMFANIFIFLVMVAMGLIAAPFAMFFGIIALAFSAVMGLVDISMTSIAGLFVVAVILMIKGRGA